MKNLIWPNKNTKLFISMAINPGNTGAILHNSLFKIYKLNNIYLPLKVKNFYQAKKLLTNLDFNGCSLSMPYKEKLIKFIDKLDTNAKKIGSINTVLRKKKKLLGFNTDYYASKEILKKEKLSKNFTVLILGCGGVAKAVLQSVIDLNFKNIVLSSRNKNKFNKLKIKKKITFLQWKKRNTINAEIIINTTPLGMFGKNSKSIPINISKDKLPKLIYDLPVNPNGNLLSQYAKKNNIKYISGLNSSFLQGIKQFEIYNNMSLDLKDLKKKIIPKY